MRPFLGIDITNNKKNDELNCEEFSVAKPSQAMTQALESSVEELDGLVEKSKLPLPLRICRWVFGGVGGILTVGLIDAVAEGISLSKAYSNAAWLFWLAGGCLVLWLVLVLIGHKKEKNVLESESGERTINKVDRIAEGIYMELGVPKDATDVDVLCFKYKLKDGVPVAHTVGLESTAYINVEMKAYTKDEQLYLVTLDNKFAFPLRELRRIQTVKKSVKVPEWNKEIEHNKGQYKAYKISVDDDTDGVCFKPYHILELEHDGETWGIYFPCYELPIFQTLTGLSAE